MFSGFWGIVTASGVVLLMWILCYSVRRKSGPYNLDPQGKPGAFEPLLQKYIQINAVAPYSLAGKTSVNVTVQYLGVTSAATKLSVVPSMVGLFTANSTGSGQAAIVNQDASTNSSSNPAALGSTVTVYETGMGTTNPQIQDNAVPQTTSAQPALPISAMIDNQQANVVSSYAAPGMLGVLVVNIQVPPTAHTGDAIPVVVQVGTSQSQQGTTMATR